MQRQNSPTPVLKICTEKHNDVSKHEFISRVVSRRGQHLNRSQVCLFDATTTFVNKPSRFDATFSKLLQKSIQKDHQEEKSNHTRGDQHTTRKRGMYLHCSAVPLYDATCTDSTKKASQDSASPKEPYSNSSELNSQTQIAKLRISKKSLDHDQPAKQHHEDGAIVRVTQRPASSRVLVTPRGHYTDHVYRINQQKHRFILPSPQVLSNQMRLGSSRPTAENNVQSCHGRGQSAPPSDAASDEPPLQSSSRPQYNYEHIGPIASTMIQTDYVEGGISYPQHEKEERLVYRERQMKQEKAPCDHAAEEIKNLHECNRSTSSCQQLKSSNPQNTPANVRYRELSAAQRAYTHIAEPQLLWKTNYSANHNLQPHVHNQAQIIRNQSIPKTISTPRGFRAAQGNFSSIVF